MGDWRHCLQANSQGHEDRTRLLLSAAAEDDISSGGNGDCIHPPTEDPGHWECDCYVEMQKRCALVKDHVGNDNYSEETCFRAQYCEYPNVCKHWKDRHCDTAEIKTYKDLLQSVAPLK